MNSSVSGNMASNFSQTALALMKDVNEGSGRDREADQQIQRHRDRQDHPAEHESGAERHDAQMHQAGRSPAQAGLLQQQLDLGTQLILFHQQLGELVAALLGVDDGLLAALVLFGLLARALPMPVRRCLILSASELLKYLETRYQAAMATSQTTIARGRNPMTSDLHYFVEQIRPQPDAGAQQLFVEFRTDTGGRETA